MDEDKKVYVTVYNSLGELFIVELKVPDPKKQYYQKYNVAASGSTNQQDPKEAAIRVVKDQLGINGSVEFLGDKGNNYYFSLKHDGDVEVNKEYAEKGQFVPREVIENMLIQDPDVFTENFLEFWNNYKDKILSSL